MPKGITNFKMLDEQCKKCLNYHKRDVKKFRIHFDSEIINESMMEALPDEDCTSGVFCVFQGCDDNFSNLSAITRNINYKRTENHLGGDNQFTGG